MFIIVYIDKGGVLHFITTPRNKGETHNVSKTSFRTKIPQMVLICTAPLFSI